MEQTKTRNICITDCRCMSNTCPLFPEPHLHRPTPNQNSNSTHPQTKHINHNIAKHKTLMMMMMMMMLVVVVMMMNEIQATAADTNAPDVGRYCLCGGRWLRWLCWCCWCWVTQQLETRNINTTNSNTHIITCVEPCHTNRCPRMFHTI